MSVAKFASPALPISLAALLLAACATSSQNAQLQHAHAAYDAASKNPVITAAASGDLQKAATYLKSADEAQASGADQAEVTHRAYLAQQQVNIAHQTAALQQITAEFRSTPRALAGAGNVFFETGRATITPGAKATIDRLAEFLKQNLDQRVRIDGYADSTGSQANNVTLSERRADAVKQALVSRGIEGGRIETHASGAAAPVASNDTAQGRQMNRRATVVVSNFNVGTGSTSSPSDKLAR
jgi:outer membrane protein OmpA-like peptidoglycan-associated protein